MAAEPQPAGVGNESYRRMYVALMARNCCTFRSTYVAVPERYRDDMHEIYVHIPGAGTERIRRIVGLALAAHKLSPRAIVLRPDSDQLDSDRLLVAWPSAWLDAARHVHALYGRNSMTLEYAIMVLEVAKAADRRRHIVFNAPVDSAAAALSYVRVQEYRDPTTGHVTRYAV